MRKIGRFLSREEDYCSKHTDKSSIISFLAQVHRREAPLYVVLFYLQSQSGNDLFGHLGGGCIKGTDNSIIVDKGKMLERWPEYIEELSHDNRGGKPEINTAIDGTTILPFEVRTAMKKMKNNKTPGPDGTATEMMKALDDSGVEIITELAHHMYDSGKIPDNLSRFIFIMIPERPGAIECELHRTISFMSHITNPILMVIMVGIRSVVRARNFERTVWFCSRCRAQEMQFSLPEFK